MPSKPNKHIWTIIIDSKLPKFLLVLSISIIAIALLSCKDTASSTEVVDTQTSRSSAILIEQDSATETQNPLAIYGDPSKPVDALYQLPRLVSASDQGDKSGSAPSDRTPSSGNLYSENIQGHFYYQFFGYRDRAKNPSAKSDIDQITALKPIKGIYSQAVYKNGADDKIPPTLEQVTPLLDYIKDEDLFFLNFEQRGCVEGASYYRDTAKVFKQSLQRYPNVKYGFYGRLICREWYAPLSGPASANYKNWQQGNDQASIGVDFVDVLMPELYYMRLEPANWWIYAKENIKEAKRVGKNKPIYAFLMPESHPDPSGSGRAEIIDISKKEPLEITVKFGNFHSSRWPDDLNVYMYLTCPELNDKFFKVRAIDRTHYQVMSSSGIPVDGRSFPDSCKQGSVAAYMRDGVWYEMLDETMKLGADGFILWGNYIDGYTINGQIEYPKWDKEAPWWTETVQWFSDHCTGNSCTVQRYVQAP